MAKTKLFMDFYFKNRTIKNRGIARNIKAAEYLEFGYVAM